MTNGNGNGFLPIGILVFALLYLGIAGCHMAQALVFARELWELAAAVLYVLLAMSTVFWGRH